MKMVVGLHPNLKLCPCNQLAVNGSQINVPAFSSRKSHLSNKHKWDIAPSPSALLLLHLFIPCPRFITCLLCKSAGFTLFDEEILLLGPKFTVKTKGAVYAIFCPKALRQSRAVLHYSRSER